MVSPKPWSQGILRKGIYSSQSPSCVWSLLQRELFRWASRQWPTWVSCLSCAPGRLHRVVYIYIYINWVFMILWGRWNWISWQHVYPRHPTISRYYIEHTETIDSSSRPLEPHSVARDVSPEASGIPMEPTACWSTPTSFVAQESMSSCKFLGVASWLRWEFTKKVESDDSLWENCYNL